MYHRRAGGNRRPIGVVSGKGRGDAARPGIVFATRVRMIGRPYVRSSTASGVTLHATRAGTPVEITISARAIEQAFQLSGTTEADRQSIMEANIGEIEKVVASRLAAAPADGPPFALDVADLEGMSMHLRGDAAAKAAD